MHYNIQELAQRPTIQSVNVTAREPACSSPEVALLQLKTETRIEGGRRARKRRRQGEKSAVLSSYTPGSGISSLNAYRPRSTEDDQIAHAHARRGRGPLDSGRRTGLQVEVRVLLLSLVGLLLLLVLIRRALYK